jgi:hypothetical protein
MSGTTKSFGIWLTATCMYLYGEDALLGITVENL